MENLAFEEYFTAVYGNRWASLKEALLFSDTLVARVNAWSPPDRTNPITLEEKFPYLDNAYKITDREKYAPTKSAQNLFDVYFMDPGSIFVARELKVKEGDIVLDMCAAPGGKALTLFENLKNSGELFANEISENRRMRLKRVVQDYIPREKRERFWIKGSDATNFGIKMPNHFDRVLLDAPCSGEKHLLHTPKELKQWSKKRTEKLAARQYGLLCSAVLTLKPGGRLVYSTCSVSPLENDGVIERFINRKGETVEVIEKHLIDLGEKTKYGRIFLPDQAGFGPLYYSVLVKK